jgi:hypothetical protein
MIGPTTVTGMTAAMRILAVAAFCAACSGGTDEGGQFVGTKTYEFGPFNLAPSQEINSDCVQITLGNEEYANVNVVELTTGKGFHHSNWFYVPEFTFPGADGTFKCNDRGFDQAIAAIKGGVFFAQSTQTPHEIQKFSEGVVVRVPPHHKLVAQIHLLNAGEAPINLQPTIAVTYIKDEDVKTRLAGLSFQNAGLALPPMMQSKFSVECDLAAAHRTALQRDPDFKIYYALAHYHELGTGLTLEAVKPGGESTVIYSTTTAVGDTLGGPVNPLFDMTGYTKVRLTCNFYNNRGATVGWGVGDQEMCVFLAFTDSTYNFGGGVLDERPPENPQMVGNTMTFNNTCDTVFANDADRG